VKKGGRSKSTVRRELEQVEAKMHALEAEKATLEASLAGTTDAAKIAEAGRRLQQLGDELPRVEERWLELTNELDTIAP
jgi:ATP-binding cassette subfamily F protein 3